eukprot:TRINITY_DN20444_c0_g3_i1.p1 TRINITY_DN20444_c0_g3~~TRINITY_DN20444_c0_g3_i1.p1  ORF type:complete len:1938 (-),score=206.23 TRINITY_DN20444_c0_g3_i1:112-5136(-)
MKPLYTVVNGTLFKKKGSNGTGLSIELGRFGRIEVNFITSIHDVKCVTVYTPGWEASVPVGLRFVRDGVKLKIFAAEHLQKVCIVKGSMGAPTEPIVFGSMDEVAYISSVWYRERAIDLSGRVKTENEVWLRMFGLDAHQGVVSARDVGENTNRSDAHDTMPENTSGENASEDNRSGGAESFPARHAIDGFSGLQLLGRTCTLTGSEHTNSWWQVDLGGVYSVLAVELTPSNLSGRINPFEVAVDGSVCGSYQWVPFQRAKTVSCSARGRFLKITRMVKGKLSICEVKVKVHAYFVTHAMFSNGESPMPCVDALNAGDLPDEVCEVSARSPWLQLDLGVSQKVGRVVVQTSNSTPDSESVRGSALVVPAYSRNCTDFSTCGLIILAGDNSWDIRFEPQDIYPDSQVCGLISSCESNTPYACGFDVRCPAGTAGRYVRLLLPGPDRTLSITKVHVFPEEVEHAYLEDTSFVPDFPPLRTMNASLEDCQAACSDMGHCAYVQSRISRGQIVSCRLLPTVRAAKNFLMQARQPAHEQPEERLSADDKLFAKSHREFRQSQTIILDDPWTGRQVEFLLNMSGSSFRWGFGPYTMFGDNIPGEGIYDSGPFLILFNQTTESCLQNCLVRRWCEGCSFFDVDDPHALSVSPGEVTHFERQTCFLLKLLQLVPSGGGSFMSYKKRYLGPSFELRREPCAKDMKVVFDECQDAYDDLTKYAGLEGSYMKTGVCSQGLTYGCTVEGRKEVHFLEPGSCFNHEGKLFPISASWMRTRGFYAEVPLRLEWPRSAFPPTGDKTFELSVKVVPTSSTRVGMSDFGILFRKIDDDGIGFLCFLCKNGTIIFRVKGSYELERYGLNLTKSITFQTSCTAVIMDGSLTKPIEWKSRVPVDVRLRWSINETAIFSNGVKLNCSETIDNSANFTRNAKVRVYTSDAVLQVGGEGMDFFVRSVSFVSGGKMRIKTPPGFRHLCKKPSHVAHHSIVPGGQCWSGDIPRNDVVLENLSRSEVDINNIDICGIVCGGSSECAGFEHEVNSKSCTFVRVINWDSLPSENTSMQRKCWNRHADVHGCFWVVEADDRLGQVSMAGRWGKSLETGWVSKGFCSRPPRADSTDFEPGVILSSDVFILGPSSEVHISSRGHRGSKESLVGERIPADARATLDGFLGVAIRDVDTNRWVASHRRKSTGVNASDAVEVHVFDTIQLSEYYGRRVTVDLVDMHRSASEYLCVFNLRLWWVTLPVTASTTHFFDFGGPQPMHEIFSQNSSSSDTQTIMSSSSFVLRPGMSIGLAGSGCMSTTLNVTGLSATSGTTSFTGVAIRHVPTDMWIASFPALGDGTFELISVNSDHGETCEKGEPILSKLACIELSRLACYKFGKRCEWKEHHMVANAPPGCNIYESEDLKQQGVYFNFDGRGNTSKSYRRVCLQWNDGCSSVMTNIGNGSQCERGIPIVSPAQCASLAPCLYYKYGGPLGDQNLTVSNAPFGCVVYSGRSTTKSGVYFNANVSGGSSESFRRVCVLPKVHQMLFTENMLRQYVGSSVTVDLISTADGMCMMNTPVRFWGANYTKPKIEPSDACKGARQVVTSEGCGKFSTFECAHAFVCRRDPPFICHQCFWNETVRVCVMMNATCSVISMAIPSAEDISAEEEARAQALKEVSESSSNSDANKEDGEEKEEEVSEEEVM